MVALNNPGEPNAFIRSKRNYKSRFNRALLTSPPFDTFFFLLQAMTEKRSFADFARFAFVEGDDMNPGEFSASSSTGASNDHQPKRIKAQVIEVPATSAAANKGVKISEMKDTQTLECVGLQELYKSHGFVERPLRLLIVGINPSDQSWTKGHYYANPSNRMWFLLAKAKIVPAGFTADCDRRCPNELGIGFTDLMSGIAETQSCNITDATLKSYKTSFFKRLEAHVQRVSESAEVSAEEAYPRIIAFAGVRQWKALFPNGHFENAAANNRKEKSVNRNQPLLTNMFSALKSAPADPITSTLETSTESIEVAATAAYRQSTIPYGLQTERPPGWPAALKHSKVFLLPSSSGAAAMSNAEREEPYIQLGALLAQEEYKWISDVGLASQGMETDTVTTIVRGEQLVEGKNSDGHFPYEIVDLSNTP